jgi:hypothetical protein
VEQDGKAVNGPAYTEVKVQPKGDYLRIGDVVFPCCGYDVRFYLHPLPGEGLIWYGRITPEEEKQVPWYIRYPGEDEEYGEIRGVAYATSTYLGTVISCFSFWNARAFEGLPSALVLRH